MSTVVWLTAAHVRVCNVHPMPTPDADDAQVIGVGAAVVGDMSTRKDWGIHELDFVFSTVVVRPSRWFALSGT